MKVNTQHEGGHTGLTPPVAPVEKIRARVLHVEGDKYVFRAIKAVMSLYEFAAIHNVHCPDQSTATKVLQSSRHFDLIITDHHPPAVDGAGLINFVRSLPHRRETPVIILATVLGNHRAAEACGAEAFFSKPPDLEEFKEAVKRILIAAS